MLFMLAWLSWFRNDGNKEGIPRDDIDDHNIKPVDQRNDLPENKETRQQIVEEEIVIFETNVDESNLFDAELEHDEHNNRSTVIVDVHDKNPKQSPETQHSNLHAELKHQRGGRVNLNVVPTTKLKVKSDTPSGRIHSIVLKDGDEKTRHTVRSVSPIIFVHPIHNHGDSHLNIKPSGTTSSSVETTHHKSTYDNDEAKQGIIEEQITISVTNLEENIPSDYDEELEGLHNLAVQNVVENPAINDELDSVFVPISISSITDNNGENIDDFRSTLDNNADVHTERLQGHSTIHAELNQPCGGSISLNVLPTGKLMVKEDDTTGHVHSVTLKDNEQKVKPRVRSVSPNICIQPESSVHENHEGVCIRRAHNSHTTEK